VVNIIYDLILVREVTGVTREEPRYWGSWKGRVIKAIVLDGAKTWNDIRDLTGLSPRSLNTALFEMFDVGILQKMIGGEYIVSREIYKDYREFFERQGISEESAVREAGQKIPVKFSEEKQKDLVRWIDQWREVKKLGFSLEPKHFFLEGRHLDDISKELICNAKSEVLVVNPYVDKCDLSDTLREASKRGIEVRLITRRPSTSKEPFRQDKRKYHRFLKEEGVSVIYNKVVHAKIVVVDRAVAIISSMNFYSSSSGGASWEAGLISVEETVVESIVNSILELLEKPESIEMP
jgi:hypothetical protein